MKVRLTETELVSLIKKIMTEQKSLLTEGAGSFADPFTDTDLLPQVDTIVDDLDGIVDGDNLKSIFDILNGLRGKVALNDDDPVKPVKVSAIKRLSDLYTIDESGDTMLADLESVGTKTLSTASTKLKTQCIAVLKAGLAEVPVDPAVTAANDVAEKEKFSACATTEPGYVKRTNWEGFAIDPFGKGWITAYRDGRMDNGYNIWYWELPPGKTQKPGDGVNKFSSTFSCVNGVMTINKWVKVQ